VTAVQGQAWSATAPTATNQAPLWDDTGKKWVPGAVPLLTATAPPDVFVTTASAGKSTESAHGDHQHSIKTATPVSLTVGGSNVLGSSTSTARSDHKHALPAFGTTTGTFCEGDDKRLSAAGLPDATEAYQHVESYDQGKGVFGWKATAAIITPSVTGSGGSSGKDVSLLGGVGESGYRSGDVVLSPGMGTSLATNGQILLSAAGYGDPYYSFFANTGKWDQRPGVRYNPDADAWQFKSFGDTAVWTTVAGAGISKLQCKDVEISKTDTTLNLTGTAVTKGETDGKGTTTYTIDVGEGTVPVPTALYMTLNSASDGKGGFLWNSTATPTVTKMYLSELHGTFTVDDPNDLYIRGEDAGAGYSGADIILRPGSGPVYNGQVVLETSDSPENLLLATYGLFAKNNSSPLYRAGIRYVNRVPDTTHGRWETKSSEGSWFPVNAFNSLRWEGSQVSIGDEAINFAGKGVTSVASKDGVTTVTVAAGSGGGGISTVEWKGDVISTTDTAINFTGTAISGVVTDKGTTTITANSVAAPPTMYRFRNTNNIHLMSGDYIRRFSLGSVTITSGAARITVLIWSGSIINEIIPFASISGMVGITINGTGYQYPFSYYFYTNYTDPIRSSMSMTKVVMLTPVPSGTGTAYVDLSYNGGTVGVSYLSLSEQGLSVLVEPVNVISDTFF
jgi:hypothetical protein